MTIVVNASGNNDIDGILWGWAWGDGGPETLTFSFPTSTTEYTDDGYVAINSFSAFNAAQQTAVRTALANISSFCNLTFTETTAADADLRFANATTVNYTDDNTVATNTGSHTVGLGSGTAEANPPELSYNGTAPYSAPYAQGDAWFTPGKYSNPLLGSFQDAAGIMHEIGHNMGLKHGHNTQSGHGTTFPTLPANHNSYEYSVMTYSQFPGDSTTDGDNAPNHPTTYMQDDIAALQYMYGANYGAGSNNGDTLYSWSTATGEAFINTIGQGAPVANYVLMTIWDGGGNDTYSFSNYTTDLSVDLNPGAWTILDTSAAQFQRADLGNTGGGAEYFARGNIANALADPNDPTETTSFIDNAVCGSGNDSFAGNSIDNIFIGNGGNDTADGMAGNDTACFSGPRSDYATSLVSGAVQIADTRAGSPDGTDLLTNFEFFKFPNRTYTLAEVLNQPPQFTPDSGPHPLTEFAATTGSNSPQTASGVLAFTDPDAGDVHSTTYSLTSKSWSGGTLTPVATSVALATAFSASIDTDGTNGTVDWNFGLADKYFDFLAVGETLSVVYDVRLADQLDNSDTTSVTMLVTGANDAVTIDTGSSDLAGSTNELPFVTGSSAIDSTSGTLAFEDPDLNDRPNASIDSSGQTVTWQDASHDYTSELTTAQITTLLSAFTISPSIINTNVGTIGWSYDIVDSAIDFLGVGESLTVTTPVVVDDHNGSTVSAGVVLSLFGSEDAPVAVRDSNGTDNLTPLHVAAADGVLSNDSDPDAHDTLSVGAVDGSAGNVGSDVEGTYGALNLGANGGYEYTPYMRGLPGRYVAVDSFDYTASDGNGGTDTTSLHIVVYRPGTNYESGEGTTLVGGNGPDVLDGSAGDCVMSGGNGPDVLIGGNNDVMTGGSRPDTFLFWPEFGANVVTDFNPREDFVQFDSAVYSDFEAMLADVSVVSGGTEIGDGAGNSVLLEGVTLAQILSHESNFHFV